MEKYIEKARNIIEALPYIKEFYKTTIVIKYGGNAMENEKLKEMVLMDIVLLSLVGINIVIVHGGGPQISDLMKKIGKKPEFKNGLRVTDSETMYITELVLSGGINKELVSYLNFHGAKAIGISGKDGNLIKAKKLNDDLGLVGEVVDINHKIILDIIEKGYIPVISPIGVGENGESYNLNADTVAGEIASSLKAEKLIYMTDIRGIYRDINDENTFMPSITEKEIEELKEKNIISGGMIPKIDSAIKALKNGVKKVHIIDGRIEHSILLELLTDAGVGTEIFL